MATRPGLGAPGRADRRTREAFFDPSTISWPTPSHELIAVAAWNVAALVFTAGSGDA